jgi:hypothetical protein
MRSLSRQPASDTPLYFFLLENTDVLLTLGGASLVIWQLAKARPRQSTISTSSSRFSNGSAAARSDSSPVKGVVHKLRQVFTALLLGLDLISRKVEAGDIQAISRLVQRVKAVVRKGIAAIDMLESTESGNGHEKEYGA